MIALKGDMNQSLHLTYQTVSTLWLGGLGSFSQFDDRSRSDLEAPFVFVGRTCNSLRVPKTGETVKPVFTVLTANSFVAVYSQRACCVHFRLALGESIYRQYGLVRIRNGSPNS